ncbi:hypothetical protein I553_3705 [Mycobacterium xenopi 4042]|uniref:Uncharacterized protein n=1 Tax=Mycobacterium xenopi 4042 TaxID=1299334 RepID=X7YS40_MYCXE|nr:hypothetical protein I553_3705 [Mycobacterium xenopi 4042]EUA17497.1 hypothetical protein I552_0698 [Mycobacterium xenopi 3993]
MVLQTTPPPITVLFMAKNRAPHGLWNENRVGPTTTIDQHLVRLIDQSGVRGQ